MFEFVCSKAAAWNCPFSLEGNLEELKKHPRTADNLEIMRRWEKARLDNFFTYEQKSSLKESDREHILLVDESGKFELQPCEQMTEATSTINQLRAFSFNRSGRLYVVFLAYIRQWKTYFKA